jgi:transcriptional regulator with XRE-family HTH domain
MYPNLKLQLWKTGIRQNRLAQMLGMDEAALSKIVNGYREPGAALRNSIANLLQSDEAWLFRRLERENQGGMPRATGKTLPGS